ncbi:MAG TPA: M50 family peptidase [Desulfurococcales archaeon]|nr:M50 family peptidase [Desulfurococcales archaeon]
MIYPLDYNPPFTQRLSEKQQILISVIVLAIAFSLNPLVKGNYLGALASAIAVALGFVCHELSHRGVAVRLGYTARYRLWPMGLVLALLLSVLTLGRIIFAAPGAVVIYPRYYWFPPSRWDQFKIAVSGPLANIVVGLISYLVLKLPIPLIPVIVYYVLVYVAYVNLFLALFNLLPIPPLDGFTVFKCSWRLWLIVFLIALIPFMMLVY